VTEADGGTGKIVLAISCCGLKRDPLGVRITSPTGDQLRVERARARGWRGARSLVELLPTNEHSVLDAVVPLVGCDERMPL
jgi:hypothetical protein